MKQVIGAAMLAGAAAASAGAAQAQSVSANVALTTDYVFRGVSLSGEDPAVQGGFDFETGNFYAGVWGSSLGPTGVSMELDLYAGFTPKLGPVALDLGVVGYFYPGADDNAAEFDFFELGAGGTLDVTPQLTLGARLDYAPENFGETGQALWYEVNGAYAFTDALAVSAALGNQSIEDVDGPAPGSPDDDYTAWNLGGTYALHGFEIDLRYHEADIGAADPIAVAGYASEASAEARVVLTLSRVL